MTSEHPTEEALTRFLTGRASPEENRVIVRHLLAACPACLAVTRTLWAAGSEEDASIRTPRPIPWRAPWARS